MTIYRPADLPILCGLFYLNKYLNKPLTDGQSTLNKFGLPEDFPASNPFYWFILRRWRKDCLDGFCILNRSTVKNDK